jgi:hypothetical protein
MDHHSGAQMKMTLAHAHPLQQLMTDNYFEDEELLGQRITPQERVHPLQHAAMGDKIADDGSVEQQMTPPEHAPSQSNSESAEGNT